MAGAFPSDRAARHRDGVEAVAPEDLGGDRARSPETQISNT
ncbi:hypothetical protein [Kitasatospora sp. NPDC058218]